MKTKRELLLGGPGLDGYAYQADVYCVDCGRAIIASGPDEVDEVDAGDSESIPQPIFFGESDAAQHCGKCGNWLYGPTMPSYSIRFPLNFKRPT